MNHSRKCGVLLHPTSLPSKYGIGDLGYNAYEFIDFLSSSKQKLWQVLPLNPTGYGESPYQGLSAFAGNPLLICLDKLISIGLLDEQDISNIPTFDEDKIQFSEVKEFKNKLFKRAFTRFKEQEKNIAYINFIKENNYWLEDYTFFAALKEYFNSLPWNQWEKPIAAREKEAVEYYRKMLKEKIEYHIFLQYTFFTQWMALKRYANDKGIRIIGDLPIYVSYDSSDTWARPELFKLDALGNPTVVSGVPPDYFSETGQLWGNPIYNWNVMEKDNYQWWKERFKALLKITDIIRIDHFRGFEAYWEVPAEEKTAINGQWVKAPGDKLFSNIQEHLGQLPIIAEDLGVITSEVNELKDKFNFPGMKVLHFTLQSKEIEQFSPYHFDKNTVVFTGTHDNDTTLGWYKKLLEENSETLEILKKYFHFNKNMPEKEVCWRFIEIAYQSPSNTAIIPLQDVLCLGSNARMNYPGTVGGNWSWRFKKDSITKDIEEKLHHLAEFYSRT